MSLLLGKNDITLFSDYAYCTLLLFYSCP